MKTSSFTLVPYTAFGTAVGNYDGSSPLFWGDAEKAAAYYSKDKSVQTLSWHLAGFIGVITIEATLDPESDTTNYFPIHVIGDGVNPVTEDDFANLEGNYTWIRVKVSEFTAGNINKVSLGY